MSEWIDNATQRKGRLKALILRLHEGEETASVREDLLTTLKSIPYAEVVEVEQQLIAEGLPPEEVLRLCDAHSEVLRGVVEPTTAPAAPEGHPLDVFHQENLALKNLTAQADELLAALLTGLAPAEKALQGLRGLFHQLFDVDKHYLRKEYLLFPFLEKAGITGPPKVMWGKHDEIRTLIKGAIEALATPEATGDEWTAVAQLVLIPALRQVDDMTVKEEEILLPLAYDTLTEADWAEIDRQTPDIGWCLYDPPRAWRPAQVASEAPAPPSDGLVRLPSGSFSQEELLAILNTLPVDVTFVDRHDKVRYFSQGSERIFQRNRAILGRDVRLCHPPGSAHVVDTILEDFKTGKADRAPFWIQKGGQFVHIEYFALKNPAGEYLGTLEMSQNLTKLRALEGEQRILSYGPEEKRS